MWEVSGGTHTVHHYSISLGWTGFCSVPKYLVCNNSTTVLSNIFQACTQMKTWCTPVGSPSLFLHHQWYDHDCFLQPWLCVSLQVCGSRATTIAHLPVNTYNTDTGYPLWNWRQQLQTVVDLLLLAGDTIAFQLGNDACRAGASGKTDALFLLMLLLRCLTQPLFTTGKGGVWHCTNEVRSG